jgi:hypothetical protein
MVKSLSYRHRRRRRIFFGKPPPHAVMPTLAFQPPPPEKNSACHCHKSIQYMLQLLELNYSRIQRLSTLYLEPD